MSIRLYLGCMFSGKTSELIREYTRWTNIDKKVLMINYSLDTRYGNDEYVYSHDKIKCPCTKTMSLMDIPASKINEYDVLLINEGQFFSDLKEFCLFYCEKFNKNIVVCGLDGTAQRQPFGQMNDLVSLADEIIKLKAYCKKCNDGTYAIFTLKTDSNENSNEIDIGGSEKYIPVCRKHYVECTIDK